jgi:hypothetical protein
MVVRSLHSEAESELLPQDFVGRTRTKSARTMITNRTAMAAED